MSRAGVTRVVLLAAVIAIFLGTAACQSSPPAPTAASPSTSAAKPSPSAQQTATAKQPPLLKASEKAIHDSLEITLLRAKVTKEYINGPKGGQKYVVLRFNTRNTGKTEKDGDVSRNLQWRDAKDGTRRSYASTTGVKLENPKSDKLAPGAEATFEQVYMVPDALTELEFHYVPGYDPIEKARWTLKIE